MFSFGQLFGLIASVFARQAAAYVTKQLGHPDNAESKAWVQVGSLALEVGAAALAAKPDHPDLRAGAAGILDAIAQSGVNAITPMAPAPTPAPTPVAVVAPAPVPAPAAPATPEADPEPEFTSSSSPMGAVPTGAL